jgi:maltose phosphorylase
LGKVADRYFKVDPWAIIEEGFDPSRSRISESMFCLANEFMGVRGYFDEGYGGDRLLGSYFNNLYEEMEAHHPQLFKGIITRVCFGVNCVDWLYTRITIDGEQLDMAHSEVANFIRCLDMKAGTLSREFVWHTKSGKSLKVSFLRFLSMVRTNVGAQRITFEPLNFSGTVQVRSGLDFSILHEIASGWNQTKDGGVANSAAGKNFWTCPKIEYADGRVAVLGKTIKSGQQLFSSFRLDSNMFESTDFVESEKFAGLDCTVKLEKGKVAKLEKMVCNYWKQTADSVEVWNSGIALANFNKAITLNNALEEHRRYWEKTWQDIDIVIDGDLENQQGVRFSIFNLHQTYHGVDCNLNVPCKGLTGEVYFGQVFWDTETYTMPFYMFTNPQAARNLLLYRHKQLPQAIERASQLDCVGARYPMCTLDGTESCATWQHGDFEIHVSVAVAYAIWHYVKTTNDRDFLYDQGIEMLLQICRYYASRGEYSPLNGEFGLYGVMGPDEYHMNVNNNCYTNVMVKKAFEYTLDVVDEMRQKMPNLFKATCAKVDLGKDEPNDWRVKAQNMRIPQNKVSGIYEQHDGYFDLPEVDVASISEAQIPIYKHWAYVRIFRYNMIKQPDTLLLPLFYSEDYTLDVKRANYEYYEARCIHESSLSPSVHSILAAELGKHQEAYDFFGYAARLDLDNYNKNTDQGLHVTSMSGAWLNMIYGFGGLRTDGEMLSFSPSIPNNWNSFRFRLLYCGSLLEVVVAKDVASFKIIRGIPVVILVFGDEYIVKPEGVKVQLKKVFETQDSDRISFAQVKDAVR